MAPGRLVLELPVNDTNEAEQAVQNGTVVPFIRSHINDAEVRVETYEPEAS